MKGLEGQSTSMMGIARLQMRSLLDERSQAAELFDTVVAAERRAMPIQTMLEKVQ